MPITREEYRKIFQKRSSNALQTIDADRKGLEAASNNKQKLMDEQASKEFNPVNSLISAGSAYVASGGNPGAAAIAALGSKRGKEIKPLESVVDGGTAGLTQGSTSIAELAKPENADKLALAAKQAGAPKKATDALEAYAKGQAAKIKAAEETKSKTDIAKAKATADATAAQSKLDAAERLAKAKIKAAEVKSDVENRRLAMKEFNLQLSEITGKGPGSKSEQRKRFIEKKQKFIEDYIAELSGDLKLNEADPMGIF